MSGSASGLCPPYSYGPHGHEDHDSGDYMYQGACYDQYSEYTDYSGEYSGELYRYFDPDSDYTDYSGEYSGGYSGDFFNSYSDYTDYSGEYRCGCDNLYLDSFSDYIDCVENGGDYNINCSYYDHYFEQVENNFLLHTVGENLKLYLLPFIIIGGTLGNALSIVILCSRDFRKAPGTVLLLALAIVDTLVLNICGTFEWADTKFHFDTYTTVLKAVDYFDFLLKTLSPWTVVLITFERFVSVVWPLRAGTVCTRSRMAISWLVVLFTSALIWLQPEYYARPLAGQTFYWLRLIVPCGIPFLLIATGNAVIIYKTCVSHRNITGMTTSSASSAPNAIALTKTLVVICILFLLTTSPLYVFRFLSFEYEDNFFLMRWATFELLEECSIVLYFVNNATNFFLYFFGGKRFRKAFINLMCLPQAQQSKVEMK